MLNYLEEERGSVPSMCLSRGALSAHPHAGQGIREKTEGKCAGNRWDLKLGVRTAYKQEAADAYRRN